MHKNVPLLNLPSSETSSTISDESQKSSKSGRRSHRSSPKDSEQSRRNSPKKDEQPQRSPKRDSQTSRSRTSSVLKSSDPMISDTDKKSSVSKTIVSPKSTPSPKKSSKVIDINNEDYVITYRVTEKYDYSVFKIENKNGTIGCFGTFDNQFNATQLMKLNYDVKTIIMNDCRYHLIVTPTFDGFVTPMIISTIDKNMTVEYFMDIFQDIIHGIIF